MSACRSRWRSRGPASPVVGFDITSRRIEELRAGHDRTREVEPAELSHRTLAYESDPASSVERRTSSSSRCRRRSTRPGSPISAPCCGVRDRRPRAASGRHRRLRIHRLSGRGRGGLRAGAGAGFGSECGRDFTVGYSPERINPGDKAHRFETITKVVSGQDARTLDIVADGLRLGGHGRHPSRAVDQGRGSRQGDREHAARSQHRVHERAVRDLSGTRHRHRRRARRRAAPSGISCPSSRAWSAATASASIRIT